MKHIERQVTLYCRHGERYFDLKLDLLWGVGQMTSFKCPAGGRNLAQTIFDSGDQVLETHITCQQCGRNKGFVFEK